MTSELEEFVKLQELRQENEKLKRLQELKEKYGVYFYRPHLKQHKFHTALATGRYLRTGNRFGKSESGICEDIAWCMGGRVWYRDEFDIFDGERNVAIHHEGGMDHPLIRAGIPNRPVKGLLIVADWGVSQRIFTNRDGSFDQLGKLFRFLPALSIGRITTTQGGYVEQVEIIRPDEFGGGSSTLTIDTIEAYKRNKLSAESADWDFIHVDEPCLEKMFKAHARGLMDRNGSYWFTCTPLDQMWMNTRFMPDPQAPMKDAEDGVMVGTKYIITGSIYDNPYRTDVGVAEFESTLTKDEIDCRIYGRPAGMSGCIYKEFVHDDHVLQEVPLGWKAYHLPPENYTVRIWWDYHIRLPQAVLFFATDPHGRLYVYDEMFDENLIQPCIEDLKDRVGGYFIPEYYIDPLAVIPNPVTRESIVDELCKYGIYFMPASKDLRLGINMVRERLKERGADGKPTIMFSPNLRETISEFSYYVYDGDKNKPKDEHDHMMENLYRAVVHGCAYMSRPTDEDLRPKRRTIISYGEDLRGRFQTKNLLKL